MSRSSHSPRYICAPSGYAGQLFHFPHASPCRWHSHRSSSCYLPGFQQTIAQLCTMERPLHGSGALKGALGCLSAEAATPGTTRASDNAARLAEGRHQAPVLVQLLALAKDLRHQPRVVHKHQLPGARTASRQRPTPTRQVVADRTSSRRASAAQPPARQAHASAQRNQPAPQAPQVLREGCNSSCKPHPSSHTACRRTCFQTERTRKTGP